MADMFTPEKRSEIMSRIRAKDTAPELQLRKGLHALGFRYRLHVRKLPGKPDLVLPKYKSAIFVNGCFWHGHACHLFRWPATNPGYWRPKITRTMQRDLLNKDSLLSKGWRVLTIWECSFRGKTNISIESVIERTAKWIVSDSKHLEIRGCDNVNEGTKGTVAIRSNSNGESQ